MSLTQEKIKSLRKLTALLSGENLSIESVLDSFASIEKVSLDPLAPVSRSGQGTLLPREDSTHASPASREALLQCSPQRVVADQIALGSIMQGE